MDALVSGEVRGLTWYEIPRAATGWAGKSLPAEVQTVTVLAPLGKLPARHVMDLLRVNPAAVSIAAKRIPFHPFDVAAELPGREVWWAFHDFTDEAITDWAHANLAIPDGIDLTFRSNHGADTVSAIARTIRNGRPVEIRRKLSPDLPMGEALQEHLPYFLRNCPRARLDVETVSAPVAAILGHADRRGTGMAISDWLLEGRENPGDTARLVIDGALLPGSGVASLTLTRDRNTPAIRGSIRTTGGHSLDDDDKGGVDVVIRGSIPATVAGALPKRDLGAVIDAPWASHVVIRKYRPPSKGEPSFGLRCSVEHVPIPDVRPDPDGATSREQLAGDAGRWTTIQSAAHALLARMDAADLADVLTILHMRGEVEMSRWGEPGWRIRAMGGCIQLAECPDLPVDALLSR